MAKSIKVDNVEYLLTSIYFYLKTIKTLIERNNNKTKILDIGCSKGYGIDIMKKYAPNAYIIGIDINDDNISQAQKLLDKYQNVSILKLDITKKEDIQYLVDKYGYFDAITCFEVYEHISPQSSKIMLRNIYSLLKEDGILFISTPNRKVYDVDAYTPGHINEVNVEEFIDILKNSSFEIVYKEGVRHISPTLVDILYNFGLTARCGNNKNNLSVFKRFLRYMLVSIYDPKRMLLTFAKKISYDYFLKLRIRYEVLGICSNPTLIYIIARKI